MSEFSLEILTCISYNCNFGGQFKKGLCFYLVFKVFEAVFSCLCAWAEESATSCMSVFDGRRKKNYINVKTTLIYINVKI